MQSGKHGQDCGLMWSASIKVIKKETMQNWQTGISISLSWGMSRGEYGSKKNTQVQGFLL